jgi:hypothetical protein
MSNTYREPTEAETEAYKKALNEVIPTAKGRAQTEARAKEAIESVFGPCTYEQEKNPDGSTKRGTLITQRSPGEDGAQVRFTLNATLT